MEIIGTGFIARNFAALAAAHPDVVLFAAGVSHAGCTSEDAFRREVDVLYGTVQQCRRKGRRLVYCSTASGQMYAEPHSHGVEDEPVFPRSAYGRHKLAMETVIRQSGTDYLILRLASPLGLHQQPHQLIPALVAQVQRGQVDLHRGAHRDLIDIEDVVAITDRLLSRNITREVVNVASGVAVPIEDIVQVLVTRASTPVQIHAVDRPDSNRVSLHKLANALGGLQRFGFDHAYYARVIDKYYPPLPRRASGLSEAAERALVPPPAYSHNGAGFYS